MRRKRNPVWVHAVLSIAVILIAAPILFAIIKATQSRGAVLSPSLIPGTEFFSNLKIVWTDQNLGQYIKNSLWIAFSVTLGKTVLSILAAMVLVFFKVRFKKVIFGFILFTLLMPTEVLIVGLFDMISMQPPKSIGEFLRWFLNPRRVLFEPVPGMLPDESQGIAGKIISKPFENPAHKQGVVFKKCVGGIVDKFFCPVFQLDFQGAAFIGHIEKGRAASGSAVDGKMHPGILEPGPENIVLNMVQVHEEPVEGDKFFAPGVGEK